MALCPRLCASGSASGKVGGRPFSHRQHGGGTVLIGVTANCAVVILNKFLIRLLSHRGAETPIFAKFLYRKST